MVSSDKEEASGDTKTFNKIPESSVSGSNSQGSGYKLLGKHLKRFLSALLVARSLREVAPGYLENI